MTTRTLLFLGLILVALAVAWVLVPPSPPGGLSTGAPAPDFTATTLDGRPLRLADLRGNVVVLNFWATWCPPCIAMIPDERALVEEMKDRPFVFVGVSADNTAEEVREFVRSQNMPWTHVFDGPQGPVRRQYQVNAFPTVYVLDAAGVIRFHGRGRQPRGRIEQVVRQLLADAH
jgi:peroxiredoxin